MREEKYNRYKGVSVQALQMFCSQRDEEILELQKLVRSLVNTIAEKDKVIQLYYNHAEQ